VTTEQAPAQRYAYRCDGDVGDVKCDYSVEYEDMERVRVDARRHRVADHREEDVDPQALDALIVMQAADHA
jgi:hypothetical protein